MMRYYQIQEQMLQIDDTEVQTISMWLSQINKLLGDIPPFARPFDMLAHGIIGDFATLVKSPKANNAIFGMPMEYYSQFSNRIGIIKHISIKLEEWVMNSNNKEIEYSTIQPTLNLGEISALTESESITPEQYEQLKNTAVNELRSASKHIDKLLSRTQ